ncbi:hypothetical protein STCU_10985 [Strigomonas culicis]|uniref:Uncharacterized protein n=1 Tax=Strigomonas culicis TaxID=28005 RepID=S9TKB8_9TRYP|nr:hypothetical protein STCU_10985 [Strigomonas culicis]|eukprot:EPY16798.1 hypothetical protein STCU_10985 [Strigomonas culicis]
MQIQFFFIFFQNKRRKKLFFCQRKVFLCHDRKLLRTIFSPFPFFFLYLSITHGSSFFSFFLINCFFHLFCFPPHFLYC